MAKKPKPERLLPATPCPVNPEHLMNRPHCPSDTCSWHRCTVCQIDVDARNGLWKAAGA